MDISQKLLKITQIYLRYLNTIFSSQTIVFQETGGSNMPPAHPPPAANPIARIKQHLVTAKVFQSDWDAS
jgi:hypothetical protein